MPDGTHFYFSDDNGPARRDLVIVDALTGERTPAYDRARLATALAAAVGADVPLERQKMGEIHLDGASGEALHFTAAGKGWRCDLRTYVVTEDATAFRPPTELLDAGAVGPTVRSGHPVELSVINRTHGPLAMDWVDVGGERRKYSDIAPGGTAVQHTYEGHKWVVIDAKGGVLAAFETPDGGGEFVIDDGMVARANVGKSEGELSPDGRTRAFVKDHQVFLGNAKEPKNKPVMLTRDGTSDASYADDNLYWSPDSTRLVAVRTRKGDDRKVYLVESSPADQLQPKRSSYDYLKPGDRVPVDEVHLFDVATRVPIAVSEALFPTPFNLTDYRWSEDSTQFGFIYNQRGHQLLRVLSVDAKSGAVRTVIEETSKTFIDYKAAKRFSAPSQRRTRWCGCPSATAGITFISTIQPPAP